MRKIIKNTLNILLKFLFVFVKSETKKASIYTLISKLLFDNKNNLQFDGAINSYWLKHDNEYLFAVKKPYFNYSKKNLYKSILEIYCKKYIPKIGDTIIDIGAGIGTETLFFNELIGDAGKIYSIEASKESMAKLSALCLKNNFKNTFNSQLAISNFNGEIWMEETENFEVNRTNTARKGIKVDCMTLDEFIKVKNISNINFLKVNIEGAEFEMIDGMKESIKIIDNISISCHDFLFTDNRKIKEKVVSFLKSNNFDIYFNKTGIQVTDSWIYGKRK